MPRRCPTPTSGSRARIGAGLDARRKRQGLFTQALDCLASFSLEAIDLLAGFVAQALDLLASLATDLFDLLDHTEEGRGYGSVGVVD